MCVRVGPISIEVYSTEGRTEFQQTAFMYSIRTPRGAVNHRVRLDKGPPEYRSSGSTDRHGGIRSTRGTAVHLHHTLARCVA